MMPHDATSMEFKDNDTTEHTLSVHELGHQEEVKPSHPTILEDI